MPQQNPATTATLIQEFGSNYASEEELLAMGAGFLQLAATVKTMLKTQEVPDLIANDIKRQLSNLGFKVE